MISEIMIKGSFPSGALVFSLKNSSLFVGISLNRTASVGDAFPRRLLISQNPAHLIHHRTAH